MQIKPQKLTIRTNIKTLQGAQKLMGDLQWLRPVVGISNEDLEVLRPLLRGTDPSLPAQPTPEQIDTIQCISTVIADRAVGRRDADLPVDFTVLHGESQLTGALTQCKKKKGEQVRVLEWMFKIGRAHV